MYDDGNGYFRNHAKLAMANISGKESRTLDVHMCIKAVNEYAMCYFCSSINVETPQYICEIVIFDVFWIGQKLTKCDNKESNWLLGFLFT